MSKTIHGFILKKVSYLEKDLIVTIFSKEYSKFPAIGIAAKKSKKRNLNLLDYFNLLKFSIYTKKNYPIPIIERVSLIERIAPSIIKPEYLIFIEILNLIVDFLVYGQEDSHELFNLYIDILQKAKSETPENLKNLLTYFKIKALKAIGLQINLNKCVICGKSGTFLNYSIEKLGLVCNNCIKNSLELKLGTIKSIEFLEKKSKNLRFTKDTINDINKIFYINLAHLRDREKVKQIFKLEKYFEWILKK